MQHKKCRAGKDVLPFENDRWAKRKAATLGSVDLQTVLGQRSGGNTQRQRQMIGGALRGFLKQITLDGCMGHIAIRSSAAAQITQDSARVMGMIRESVLKDANGVNGDLQRGRKLI